MNRMSIPRLAPGEVSWRSFAEAGDTDVPGGTARTGSGIGSAELIDFDVPTRPTGAAEEPVSTIAGDCLQRTSAAPWTTVR